MLQELVNKIRTIALPTELVAAVLSLTYGNYLGDLGP